MLIAMMMAAHTGAAPSASKWPTIMASMTVSRPSTPPAPSPADNEDTMLIVDGVRIDASAAALAACLARSCPPDEDMEAATVHAENQLLAGDHQGARDTLRQARARNHRHQRDYPVQVGQLLDFDADVASYKGLADYSRTGTIDALDALTAGLPLHDRRIAMQRMRVGDVFLRQGKMRSATGFYDRVAKEASAQGWPEMEGFALFRGLTAYATAASVDPAYDDEAQRRYAALKSRTVPAIRPYQDAALIMLAKLELMKNGLSEEELTRRLSGLRSASPLLVVGPRIEAQGNSLVLWTDDRRKHALLPANPSGHWAEFRYLITPDGRIDAIEQVGRGRATSHVSPEAWADLVGEALAQRRYLPLALAAGSPGLWQRERFLLTADLELPQKSHTRIRRPGEKLHIRSFQITENDAD